MKCCGAGEKKTLKINLFLREYLCSCPVSLVKLKTKVKNKEVQSRKQHTGLTASDREPLLRPEAFTATANDEHSEISSGQPYKNGAATQRFGDCICLHHPG
jgi:hypothetical protein